MFVWRREEEGRLFLQFEVFWVENELIEIKICIYWLNCSFFMVVWCMFADNGECSRHQRQQTHPVYPLPRRRVHRSRTRVHSVRGDVTASGGDPSGGHWSRQRHSGWGRCQIQYCVVQLWRRYLQHRPVHRDSHSVQVRACSELIGLQILSFVNQICILFDCLHLRASER